MKIRNKRPFAVEIAAVGVVVDGGDVVEVDDDLGSSLCEQVDAWEKAAPSKAAKADSEEKV